MMIVKPRSGSSGARRTQPRRRSSLRVRSRWVPATGGAIAVIRASLPVGLADGLGVQLSLGQRGLYRLGAGDGRAELLADVGAEVLELGDVQELDAGVGHRFQARVGRVGRVDRLQGERAVDRRQL